MKRLIKAGCPALLLFTLSAGTVLGQHILTLSLKDMDIHVGQLFQVRVVDQASGVEVGRKTLTAVPSADFEVELFVLVTNHSYWIDFYADANQNGIYDIPPADHAYRLSLNNIQGDEILEFTHNSGFTDIGWDNTFNIPSYAGTWTGTWVNLTYGSTADANANFIIVPDSHIVRVTSTSRLILGNPDTETKTGEGFYNDTGDSLFVNAPPPWTGTAVAVHGEIYGTGTAPDFGGTNIEIKGNFGPSQMMAAFYITGPFDANGIILMTKNTTSVEEERLAAGSSQFRLEQNYPNPFNPETAIRYRLPAAQHITMTVHDMMGKTIETLIDGVREAGRHTVRWQAENLPSGVYFYRLTTADHIETRTMILQK